MIDPTTNVGKVRLRVADFSQPYFLPDEVYEATLEDTNNNIVRSSSIIANYILGLLARKTHRKLQNLEVWGSEIFNNYRRFLLDTIKNPGSLLEEYPVPYTGAGPCEENPILVFINDWNRNIVPPNQSKVLHELAKF